VLFRALNTHQNPTRPTPTPSQHLPREDFWENVGFSFFPLVLDRQFFRCNNTSFDNKILLLKKPSQKTKTVKTKTKPAYERFLL
jgi:hypothetical protein